MKISEVISHLEEIKKELGDISVQIDHINTPFALDISAVIPLNNYIGAGWFAAIYLEDRDIKELMEYYKEKGYEEARGRL